MIYSFVKEALDREKLELTLDYQRYNLVVQKGYKNLTAEEKKEIDNAFNELWHSETYERGIVRRGGWVLVYPDLKTYWVMEKYTGIRELKAYNKGMIRRNATQPSHIIKIVEVE